MKKNLILLMAIGILSATASFGFQKPVTIKEQGSFMAGGTVVTSPGEYKDSEPMNFDGETLHGDHAYVFYQKPVKAKKNSIVIFTWVWTVRKKLGKYTRWKRWISKYIFGKRIQYIYC